MKTTPLLLQLQDVCTQTKRLLIASVCLLFAAHAQAATPEEMILKKLEGAGPNIPVNEVRPSRVESIYEVELSTGEILYSTADGGYIFTGDMYQVAPQGFKNITEERRMAARAKEVAALDENQMVVFPATGEKKGQITVFTDIDCAYCRKLHQEVKELNDMGISVRYLGFPRAGVGSGSYYSMVSVWCSENQQDAMSRAKRGESIDEKQCENPIADQYRLGQQLGVQGTPAIFLDDGRLLPGYMPAKRLATALGLTL
ncbi:DsbC family protein [Oceanospirillum maris]|uniref:DsbC family protein n=1 Tax=Oceanospirillum maris TaxID=64977 RepID=UPI0003FFC403|nr:DsbC family protein [Oceanospirillum maris]